MHRSYAESRSGFDAFAAKEIRRRHSLSPGRLQFDQPEPSGSALDYWIRLDTDDCAGRFAEAVFDRRAPDENFVAVQTGSCDWPRIVRTRHPLDLRSARRPVNQRVFLFNLCRVSRERFVLWRLDQCSALGEIDRLERRGCAQVGELFLQSPLRIVRFNRKFALEIDRAGVHPLDDAHERDSGFGVAREDRDLDWSGAAMPRQ